MHAKHTPAPWHKAWGKVTDSEGKAICMVTYRKNGPRNDSLIAEAPAMLAMLEKLTRAIERLPAASPLDGLAEDARAVIARATGEA